MKKVLFVLLLLGLIVHLGSIEAYAAFLITLKSGRTISTDSYQVEGNGMMLYWGSGTVKIPKDEVQSIHETKVEIKEERKEEDKGEKKDLADNLDKKKSEREDAGSYIKRKVEIGERLEEAKKAYFDATEKYEKERARERMISISRELFSLQEEVRVKNKGTLPEWWKEK